jgi:hypothetical protein
MVVRIRLGKRPKPAAKRARNRHLAQGIAVLLKPAALMALALGIWGLAADLKLTSSFAIASGWLSHWAVWIGMAVLLEFCSFALNRYSQTTSRPRAEGALSGLGVRNAPE